MPIRADLYSDPAFARIGKRADELMAARRVGKDPNLAAPYGHKHAEAKSWPELIGSGNPEAGDYAAGLERESPWKAGLKIVDKEFAALHDLTAAYVRVLVRMIQIQQTLAFLSACYGGGQAKPAPLAVHCTVCGKDEPGPECKTCPVTHCPIRPLLKSKPAHAAKHARKAVKAHPKRKRHARKK